MICKSQNVIIKHRYLSVYRQVVKASARNSSQSYLVLLGVQSIPERTRRHLMSGGASMTFLWMRYGLWRPRRNLKALVAMGSRSGMMLSNSMQCCMYKISAIKIGNQNSLARIAMLQHEVEEDKWGLELGFHSHLPRMNWDLE